MLHPRTTRLRHPALVLGVGLSLLLAACAGDADEPIDTEDASSEEVDDAPDEEVDDEVAEADLPHIVATTSILGDLVENLVDGEADVEVIMPAGVDPHGFEPSASDGRLLREADLVVANGLDLEEQMVSVLEAAEEDGVTIVTLADQLDPIDFDWDGPGHDHGHDDDDHGHDDEDDHGHDDEDDHGHEDDDHGHGHDDDDHGHDDDDHGHEDDDHGHEDDDHGHGHDDDDHGHEDDDHGHEDDDHGHEDDDHGHSHDDGDPHFWFDPLRTADGVQLLAEELAEHSETLDHDDLMERAEAYGDELRALDGDLEAVFETIPEENRQLVTNHDALGYLADRYGFEVLGTVIPGASTQAEQDPAGFAELIETVEEAQVPAVFAENTDSTTLAEQLQSEVVGRGDLDVEVVRIYTDALGEEGSGAETYLGLLETTSRLITEALGGSVD